MAVYEYSMSMNVLKVKIQTVQKDKKIKDECVLFLQYAST